MAAAVAGRGLLLDSRRMLGFWPEAWLADTPHLPPACRRSWPERGSGRHAKRNPALASSAFRGKRSSYTAYVGVDDHRSCQGPEL